MPYVLRSTPPRSVTARSALSRSDLEPPPAYLNRFTPSTRPATTNSLPQCGSSVVGARHSTRFAARLRSRPAANAATCRVFPKPMSSARIPPRPCSCRFHIQRTPSRWWSYRRDASAPASSKRGPPSRPFRRIGRGPPDGSSGFRGDTWEGALPRSEAKGAPLGDALEARGFDRVVAGVAGVAARRGSGGPGAGTDGARACGGLVAGATGAKGPVAARKVLEVLEVRRWASSPRGRASRRRARRRRRPRHPSSRHPSSPPPPPRSRSRSR